MSRSNCYDHEIGFSNRDKPLFPDGTTKGRLIDYYSRIADVMLPHVAGRPLTLYRCPDGIESDGFYQKQIPDHAPSWVGRTTVRKKGGGEQTLIVAESRDTLAWMANQAAVTLHAWCSRKQAPERPDRLVIDLDPADEDFARVRSAALWCRDLFEQLELRPWVATTGSRGLHVVVALDGKDDFDTVRDLARDAMDRLARRHADVLTTEIRKEKRAGRLFLDVGRNAYGQTAVAPYCVRAIPGAPVAMPLDWGELANGGFDARSWTIRNVFRRLGQREDAWRGIEDHQGSASRAARRLTQFGDRDR
jgi:bifunctional non-homologous end joining protein LigD